MKRLRESVDKENLFKLVKNYAEIRYKGSSSKEKKFIAGAKYMFELVELPPILPSISSSNCFHEDFAGATRVYIHFCSKCQQLFRGRKEREICKTCMEERNLK